MNLDLFMKGMNVRVRSLRLEQMSSPPALRRKN